MKNKKRCFGYYFLTVVIFLAVLYFQIKLINYVMYDDEAETIVGAQMMGSGLKLYKDIFNLHGPFTFVPGMILSNLFSETIDVRIVCRCLIILLNIISLIIIYFSSVFNHISQRVVAIASYGFMICILCPKLLLTNAYTYQTFFGVFSVIILFIYILPILFEKEIKGYFCFIANVLIATLPFIGVNCVPACVLFFIIGLKRKYLKDMLLGIFTGFFINIILLCLFCSLKGFFAIHIFYNANAYQTVNPIYGIITNIFNDQETFISFILLLLGGIRYGKGKKIDIMCRSLLFPFLVVMIGYRRMIWDFQGSPYWMTICALLSLLIGLSVVKPADFINSNNALLNKILKFSSSIYTTILVVCMMIGFSLNLTISDIDINKFQSQSLFSMITDKLTIGEDKVLALPFAHNEYLIARRLPASAAYWYMPWTVDYIKSPYFNVNFSLLTDIQLYKPKVILSNGSFVPEVKEFNWDLYAKDIQDELDRSYINVDNTNIWVLKEIFEENVENINDVMRVWYTGGNNK